MKRGDVVLFDPATREIEVPASEVVPPTKITAVVIDVRGNVCDVYLTPNVADPVRTNVPVPR